MGCGGRLGAVTSFAFLSNVNHSLVFVLYLFHAQVGGPEFRLPASTQMPGDWPACNSNVVQTLPTQFYVFIIGHRYGICVTVLRVSVLSMCHKTLEFRHEGITQAMQIGHLDSVGSTSTTFVSWVYFV